MSGGPDRWDDESFLGYVETHSRTELALFHRDHVLRLLELAGREPPDHIGAFVSVQADVADVLVSEARERLRGAAAKSSSP